MGSFFINSCHCEPIEGLDKLREAISGFLVITVIAAVSAGRRIPRNDM